MEGFNFLAGGTKLTASVGTGYQALIASVRQGGQQMPDHVYRIIEVAGSSENSIEDAIRNAVERASRTLRQVGWFEVLQTRGHVEDGKVAHFQVILKVGFTLEDS